MLELSMETKTIIEKAAESIRGCENGEDFIDYILGCASDEQIVEICSYLMQDVEEGQKRLAAIGISEKGETGFKIRTANGL